MSILRWRTRIGGVGAAAVLTAGGPIVVSCIVDSSIAGGFATRGAGSATLHVDAAPGLSRGSRGLLGQGRPAKRALR